MNQGRLLSHKLSQWLSQWLSQGRLLSHKLRHWLGAAWVATFHSVGSCEMRRTVNKSAKGLVCKGLPEPNATRLIPLREVAAPVAAPWHVKLSMSLTPPLGLLTAPQTAASVGVPEEDPPSTCKLGITLRGLRSLMQHLKQELGEQLVTMSTKELMEQWVKVVTTNSKCRLLELEELVDSKDVQPPMYFISHAWMNRALHMFEFVMSYLQDASESVSVWIDILSVNQHEETWAHQLDVRPDTFCTTIKCCSAGTIVVLDAEMCSPATRAWCLLEWAHTLAAHGPDGFHMMLDPAHRAALFGSIDVKKAECFKAEDKAMILAEVLRTHTSTERFDDLLKLQLMLEPLSCTADIRRLKKQSAAMTRDFTPIDAWLASGTRALCISAGAGEGKSTIATFLVGCELVGDGGNEPLVSAHHFLKYNDQRRLEPVRIIKSLAFQLACRLAGVCQHLLRLDVAKVAKLADADEAFQLLLLEPARQLVWASSSSSSSQRAASPIIILMDALDEADPPALHQASGNDGLPLTCPTVCGNKALQLVTKQLVQLPSNVRFIFTTRPDAAVGQVVPCLERTFPSSVTVVGARNLHSGCHSDGEVMVYHSAAAAWRSMGGAAGPTPRTPQLGDVYRLYARIFETAAGRYDQQQMHAVADLLSVLLAAQEPLSHSFLQQMGLDKAIELLPGHPQLFFVEEHHLYLLHKTLGDWLLHWEPSRVLIVQLQRGHELIGLHLAHLWHQGRGSLSGLSYLPKYAVPHLSAAAATSPTTAQALDALLCDFEFLHAVACVHQLGAAIRALAGMAVQTVCSYDVLRWLQANQHDLVGKSPDDMAILALKTGRWMLTSPLENAASAHTTTAGPWRTRLHLPNRCWDKCQFVLKGHSEAVTSVAFSPDGRQLASSSSDGTVCVWNTASGQCIATLQGHTSPVTNVAFSPDGKQLASSSNDKSVRVWDAASGQCTAMLQGHTSKVTSVAFSPDGKQLASSSWDETVRVWDVASGQCTATLLGHTRRVTSVAFSPDGKQLASSSWDKTVRVWDVESGQCAATLLGHTHRVTSVALSPDGKQLASSSYDKIVRVWDVESGQCTAMLLGHTSEVTSVAFSPDGKQLASSSWDETARVWDEASGQCTATLLGHTSEVTSVAFSPDGKQLASSSYDETVRVWDAASGQCTATLLGRTDVVTSVAFSPDGKQLASSSSDKTARVWDVASGQCTATLPGHTREVTRVAFSPDGKQLASSSWDKTVRVWDAASGQCTALLLGHTRWVTSVAFSPDGKQLASSGDDRTVRVWDAASGQCTATLLGHTDTVTSVAFSPDGKQLASSSYDKTVRVWDAASGQCTATLLGHIREVTRVAFSPDGKQLASSSSDNTVRVWDAASGQCTATLLGHTHWVTSVAFSPDGKQLASSSWDETVRVWDEASGQCTATLLGHTDTVISVAFGPDGKQLASSSFDKTVRVWDAASGLCTAMLLGHTSKVTSLAFSPDGKQLASSTLDKTVQVWDAVS